MLDASSKAGKQSFKTIIALYARVFGWAEVWSCHHPTLPVGIVGRW